MKHFGAWSSQFALLYLSMQEDVPKEQVWQGGTCFKRANKDSGQSVQVFGLYVFIFSVLVPVLVIRMAETMILFEQGVVYLEFGVIHGLVWYTLNYMGGSRSWVHSVWGAAVLLLASPRQGLSLKTSGRHQVLVKFCKKRKRGKPGGKYGDWHWDWCVRLLWATFRMFLWLSMNISKLLSCFCCCIASALQGHIGEVRRTWGGWQERPQEREIQALGENMFVSLGAEHLKKMTVEQLCEEQQMVSNCQAVQKLMLWFRVICSLLQSLLIFWHFFGVWLCRWGALALQAAPR